MGSSLFTHSETKNLIALLSRAVEPDDAFTLAELHGFLSGLAVTPALINPGEWLPIIFGEELMEFESEEEAKQLMGCLFETYNRINSEHHDGRPVFPFDMSRLKDGDIERISDWTNGFFVAIFLRDEVWGLRDMDEDRMSEDDEEIATSIGIIIAIARPEHAAKIFKKPDYNPEANNDDLHLESVLFVLLPEAVATLQRYARDIWKAQLKKSFPGRSPLVRRPKIGRNSPCPCGSGKKYKKCCGLN
jgi:uncharacterized protein